MKPQKSILTALLLFLALTVTAQQGINYKALIKDSSGNVLASAPVSIQFIIYQGAALTNNVYQETHTVNTDANGIVIVNIGQGTTSDVFTNINWGVDQHFLNVQINTGTGLVDLGTTEFMSVPYAEHATTATTATNVTGLEKITEGGNTGWRLVGETPANYGDIGNHATDLSSNVNPSTTMGATGYNSFAVGEWTTASGITSTAMGTETTASGDRSTAMGSNTTASGGDSIAMGLGTTASGGHSTAMGWGTTASGDNSTAIGYFTEAKAKASTAIGYFNIGGGSPSAFVSTDPLFEVGNGTGYSTHSNALTVLKNGTITAPSLTNALITTAGAKALITKEYADTNLTPTGLEKITEGGNTGWRLVGQNPANYGDIGFNATDLSYSDSASTTKGATNNHAFTTGFSTTASGDASTAMGDSTIASGNDSTAMGVSTNASGPSSTSMGIGTTAMGNASTAMGSETKAEAIYSTAIGAYNIGGGNPTSFVNTNPLFEIGNGTFSSRSNAFTVFGGTDASLASNSGFMMLGNSTSSNLVFDTNEIMARNNGSTSTLSLQAEGGDLIINNSNYFKDNGNVGLGTTIPSSKLDVFGVIRARNNVWPTASAGVEIAYDNSLGKGYVQSYDRSTSTWKDLSLGGLNVYPVLNGTINLGTSTNRWKAVYAVNGTIQTSDRRLKKEINNITYGLNTVMKLRPVSYKWKKGNQDLNLGLIAQEVQKLIPEVIDVGDDKDKTLGMKYTELIPVLIKGMQEQNEIINSQKDKINSLTSELVKNKDEQNKNYKKLLRRIEQLEYVNNQ